MSIFNPANSGKTTLLHKVHVAWFSGTLGQGTVFFCFDTTANQTAPTGGQSITLQNADIGVANSPVTLVRTNSTVPNTPTILAVAADLGARAGATALGPQLFTVDVDGSIAIASGFRVDLQAIAAAGTSPVLAVSVLLEEVPTGQE